MTRPVHAGLCLLVPHLQLVCLCSPRKQPMDLHRYSSPFFANFLIHIFEITLHAFQGPQTSRMLRCTKPSYVCSSERVLPKIGPLCIMKGFSAISYMLLQTPLLCERLYSRRASGNSRFAAEWITSRHSGSKSQLTSPAADKPDTFHLFWGLSKLF